MDMLLDVLGDWTEVRAIARRQARRIRTEDVSLAHVVFASGAVASGVHSVLAPRGWQVRPGVGGRGAASGHREQFAEVLACLAAGRRPPVTPVESRRTLS